MDPFDEAPSLVTASSSASGAGGDGDDSGSDDSGFGGPDGGISGLSAATGEPSLEPAGAMDNFGNFGEPAEGDLGGSSVGGRDGDFGNSSNGGGGDDDGGGNTESETIAASNDGDDGGEVDEGRGGFEQSALWAYQKAVVTRTNGTASDVLPIKYHRGGSHCYLRRLVDNATFGDADGGDHLQRNPSSFSKTPSFSPFPLLPPSPSSLRLQILIFFSYFHMRFI